MVLSVPLRVVLALGIVLELLGWFVLDPPAGLWATLLGGLVVIGVIVAGFAQQSGRRRRG